MRQITSRPPQFQSPSNSLPWLAAAGLSAAALFAATKLAARVRRPKVNLRGKTVLITGGSRGLGLALAHEFGDQGCRLALCARDAQELEHAAQQLQAKSMEVATFTCDLTRQDELELLVNRVLERFGRIDVLVNDAGTIKVSPLENLTHSDFDEAMNLMFWAPVNLTLAVLPHMKRAGGGHVINITSVGGRVAVPHLLPYSCAKFAFVGFSTGLSSELDPEDVHVLTVIPGLMRTGSYLNASFKGQTENEFAWFSVLGNLPGFSVSAEQAAHEVRRALEQRQLTCTVSLPAKVLIHAEALLPEATRTVMQLTRKFMIPSASANTSASTGKNLDSKFGGLFHALTSMGQLAARALNQ